jgi:hypothetical protein
MPYSASAGLQVATSASPNTFYSLTDHNRQPIRIEFDIIEKANRMADGTLRKFVVARKRKIGVSWSELPSGTTPTSASLNTGYSYTVDGFKGGAWMKSFYEQNVFNPIYLKIVHSQDTASANAASAFYASPSSSAVETMNCFISSFSYEVVKRYALIDIVNISMEFTEI